jgi:hypothetical protein
MAWKELKAATESTLYDGQGSYKSIMYRLCSLVRKDGQQHAGWCTASEAYIAQTTGFSERQVQRAVAQFKKDGVFTVRTYRKGGKEFNHYRPNQTLFEARKRNLEEPVLVSETVPDDTEADDEETTRHAGVRPHDTMSNPTRHSGGVVRITSEEKGRGENARQSICKSELCSSGKGFGVAIAASLSGKDNGGSAPEPPLCSVSDSSEESSSRFESESNSSASSASPLESAADAARSKAEMLAALAAREPVPPPPSKEALAPPPTSAAPRPTTPFQIAKALVEETKRSAWDTYLRAYSLAYQLAGYLEERKAKGEKAYAFDHWAVLYTADFIDALNRGWRFKDIEDAIDAAQTTKYRFVCCTPLRLFENGESVMKLVYALRRTGKTLRQKLGEQYPSWYLGNAGSYAVEEMKQTVEDDVAEEQRSAEEERRREMELDEDVPVLALVTTGKVKCINPDCPYRFDTRELMRGHFKECFQKAVEAEPIDAEDALREQLEDGHDDKYGIIPCSYYHWYEEDEKAGRWDRYAPENADGGMMFNPWAEEDAACVVGTEAQREL